MEDELRRASFGWSSQVGEFMDPSGLPSHRSKVMRAWIAEQRNWLVVEQLAAYGRDLNPVELIWGNLKSSELANLCPATIEEAAGFADEGLDRIGGDADLCFAFLRHCGLKL